MGYASALSRMGKKEMDAENLEGLCVEAPLNIHIARTAYFSGQGIKIDFI